jgi:6-pyruvoyltetrahydropterin/6-carboxytetrahydropterin synthase
MIEISKWFEFEAAHSLPHLPHTHKCHNLHGHSYKICVVCAGEIDRKMGWVIDYADISKPVDTVIKALDHTNLDTLFWLQRLSGEHEDKPRPSTAENLAIWFFQQLKAALPSLVEIRVKETSKTEVVYRPPRA